MAKTAEKARIQNAAAEEVIPAETKPIIQEAPPVPQKPGTRSTEFLNREVSWLEFNRRVLHEAVDSRTPLLERAQFLSIFNSNLDEFFQKRVGGLKRQIAAGINYLTPDGMTPTEQLGAIRKITVEMLEEQANCFKNLLRPALAKEGIHLLYWSELTPGEKEFARQYYRANIFPVVTPLAV